MKPKRPVEKKTDVTRYEVSSEELLRFTFEHPTSHARWTHRLEGTCYGKKWSAHLTREGVRQLIMLLMEAM